LANDNNMLLERLMCTLPKTPEQHWSDMSDAWNVNLWDIYPKCQVAGVGNNDTVIIACLINRSAIVPLANNSRRMDSVEQTFAGSLLPE
jgi:hypothetical protein